MLYVLLTLLVAISAFVVWDNYKQELTVDKLCQHAKKQSEFNDQTLLVIENLRDTILENVKEQQEIDVRTVNELDNLHERIKTIEQALVL